MISVKKLNIKANNKDIVRGLSFNTNSLLFIIGESGGGKSLIAEAILGILDEKLTVDGSIDVKGSLAYIPQTNSYIDPHCKLYQQMAKDLLDKKKADKILNSLGLDINILNMYKHQISGGMAKRFLLAMAIYDNADNIIADEPTRGLDKELAIKVFEYLIELSKTKTVIIITHDLDLATSYEAERLYIKSGQIINDPLYLDALIAASPQNMYININRLNNSTEYLELKNVDFSYDNKEILKNFSFKCYSNEIIGIWGKSGVGKSTIAKLLASYIPSDLITSYPFSLPNPVQIVFQDSETMFNPYIKLKYILKENPNVIDNFKLLGLNEELLNRYSYELSGGELHRLAIARALHPELKFLILDEATATLDMITQEKILKIVINYCIKNNIGIILISHNKILINKLCNRVYNL